MQLLCTLLAAALLMKTSTCRLLLLPRSCTKPLQVVTCEAVPDGYTGNVEYWGAEQAGAVTGGVGHCGGAGGSGGSQRLPAGPPPQGARSTPPPASRRRPTQLTSCTKTAWLWLRNSTCNSQHLRIGGAEAETMCWAGRKLAALQVQCLKFGQALMHA